MGRWEWHGKANLLTVSQLVPRIGDIATTPQQAPRRAVQTIGGPKIHGYRLSHILM